MFFAKSVLLHFCILSLVEISTIVIFFSSKRCHCSLSFVPPSCDVIVVLFRHLPGLCSRFLEKYLLFCPPCLMRSHVQPVMIAFTHTLMPRLSVSTSILRILVLHVQWLSFVCCNVNAALVPSIAQASCRCNYLCYFSFFVVLILRIFLSANLSPIGHHPSSCSPILYDSLLGIYLFRRSLEKGLLLCTRVAVGHESW